MEKKSDYRSVRLTRRGFFGPFSPTAERGHRVFVPQICISCWVQIVSTAHFQAHLKTITEENEVRYGGFEDSQSGPILTQPHK